MQIITHESKNINSVFDEIERAYQITSIKKHEKRLVPFVFDFSFVTLFTLFQDYSNAEYDVRYTKKPTRSDFKPLNEDTTVIVCYSGGKDSTATILHYIELGYKVYLYHLKGINYTYKDEHKAVEKLAEILNIPVLWDEVKLEGKQEWVEHPLKNWIIANQALQYGIKEEITTNIAFGNFSSSTLEQDPFDVCGGDCQEMWRAYESVIHKVFPDFHIKTPLVNFQDTIDIILKRPDLLPYTQSCIGPYRYREYLKKKNENSYNITLPHHRCGSCWKCCLEYCVFCDKGIYEYNEGYYSHCMEVLQKTLHKETHVKYNMSGTWNHYFFYDKRESKWNGFS